MVTPTTAPGGVISPDGRLVGPEVKLSSEQLVELFRILVRTRTYDRRATALRRQGRIGEYYSCAGQEALAGAVLALDATDWVFSAYRDQPALFMRGLPVKPLLSLQLGLPPEGWDSHRYRLTRMNASIGTHLPHAVGFAYASRLAGEPTTTMAIFSDGATSESDFHSALNFAGVWRTPTIFLCQNNQYAQSVALANQTAGVIAEKAIGYGIAGVRVDGMDPLAMYQATADALSRARSGGGPTLIEMVTYRFHGHASFESNPLQYRPAGEPEAWMELDPLIRMRLFLQAQDLVTDEMEQRWVEETQAECEQAMAELEGRGLPPRAFAIRDTYERIPRSVVQHFHEVQSDLGEPLTEFAPSELFIPDSELPLPSGEMQDMTHVEAVRSAMRSAMRRDASMICIGEDIGVDGGCFKATDGFLKEFGADRVIDSPLCETGIVGTAVGMSVRGNRVMAEIQLAGFIYPALDQILSHVSRTRTRYQGTMTCPIVIRAPGGGGFRGFEFHMDSPEGLLMTMPGTTIVASSSPLEAKGLLTSALEHPDPVVFLEPISIYRTEREPVPVGDYRIPLGRAKIARPGQDVTIVAYGRLVQKALAAAALAAEEGISAEVIDLRTIRPWDEDTVFASVSRTRRLVTVHDSHRSGGVGAEIAARVSEELFDSLVAPIARVAVFDANRPVLRCEALAEVDEQWILGAVRRTTGQERRS